jgi:5-hydroxyisourate hydrolase
VASFIFFTQSRRAAENAVETPPSGEGEVMSRITTHVLDTARGRPASGVPVTLSRVGEDGDVVLGRGDTDRDGRLRDLMGTDAELAPGRYKLTFDTASYFQIQGVKGFYPEVAVLFEVRDPGEDHHIPLLLSPHGYSTYRGS